MTNPFDNDTESFLVLINDEGQHSLWPSSIKVPAGWVSRFGPETRKSCIEHIEQHWTDMRPNSLVQAMRS